MKKETIIGAILMLAGILFSMDKVKALHFGSFYFGWLIIPIVFLSVGWLLMHGPEPMRRRFHHSHLAAVIKIICILMIIWGAYHHWFNK